jgi:outer membrane lipoprotein
MMKKHLILFAILSAVAAAMTACAPTFSKEIMEQVDRTISFRDLVKAPERYQGKWVMLGGVIIETRNSAQGSTVEVLQTPLDRQGRPRETDETAGRFIVESPEFLDAAVYQPGKRISLVGQVRGQEVRPLGEMNYRYPVISSKELRLWEQGTSPRVSFGFGVGVYHRF